MFVKNLPLSEKPLLKGQGPVVLLTHSECIHIWGVIILIIDWIDCFQIILCEFKKSKFSCLQEERRLCM